MRLAENRAGAIPLFLALRAELTNAQRQSGKPPGRHDCAAGQLSSITRRHWSYSRIPGQEVRTANDGFRFHPGAKGPLLEP
jgi:hypothetical protein